MPSIVVKALFDYTSTEPSALSFHQGDIIYVLTRLDSGWWDGLCHNNRGWFPSNFTEIIEFEGTPVEPEGTPANVRIQELLEEAAARGARGNRKEDDDSSQQGTHVPHHEQQRWLDRRPSKDSIMSTSSSTGRGTGTLQNNDRRTNALEQIPRRSERTSSTPSTSSTHTTRLSSSSSVSSYSRPAKSKSPKSPDPQLPIGWTIHPTDDGSTWFYYNAETKEGRWTLPTNDEYQDDDKDQEDNENGEVEVNDGKATSSTQKMTYPNPTETTLPPNWGSKTTPLGRQYFYNCVTDDTVWTLEDVDAVTGELKMCSLRAEPSAVDEFSDQPLNLGGRRPSTDSSRRSGWTELTANVVLHIHDLHQSARNRLKGNYITQSTCIVEAIRVMLQASAPFERDASLARGHKVLGAHHKNIMSVLAKLVLSAKLAAGVWPPPDAHQRLQAEANEVLLAVRHFVAAAQDARIDVHAIDAQELSTGEAEGRTSRPNAASRYPSSSTPSTTSSQQQQQDESLQLPSSKTNYPRRTSSVPMGALGIATNLQPRAGPNQRIHASGPSSSSQRSPPGSNNISNPGNAPDFLAQLDVHLKSIFKATGSLTSHVKLQHTLQSSTDLNGNRPKPDPRATQSLISETRATVTEVGDFLSLVEDLSADSTSPTSPTRSSNKPLQSLMHQSQQTKDFLLAKQTLYNAIAGLVMATQMSTDPLAPSDAFSELCRGAATVNESVQELSVATKRLLEERGEHEREILQRDVVRFGERTGTGRVGEGANSKGMRRIAEEGAGGDKRGAFANERRVDSELPDLQPRRAMSLNYLGNEIPKSGSTYTKPTSSAPDKSSELSAAEMTAEPPRASLRKMSNGRSTKDSVYNRPTPTSTSSPNLAQRRTGNDIVGLGIGVLPAGQPEPLTPVTPGSFTAKRRSDERSRSTSSLSPMEVTVERRPSEVSFGPRFLGRSKEASATEKLRRFFGESPSSEFPPPPVSSAVIPPSPETPWFLNYDYSPDDIVFNADGQVKGGTLECLLERLTLHDALDSNFTATFLLAYRSFTTSEELFELLVGRFMIAPPEGLDKDEMEAWIERKQTPVRLRVFNILKSWLENYYLDNDEGDRNLLYEIRAFAATTGHENMPFAAAQLIKVIEKRLSSEGTSRRMVLSNPTNPTNAPSPILPRNRKKIKFMDTDALEVARQLTILESRLYIRIQPVECLNKAWSDKESPDRAPNIKAMIESSNQLTGWCAGSILAEKDLRKRTAMIKHFVAIAEKCHALNNFNSLMAILAGLGSAPIHRLKRTWELVNSKSISTLDFLRKTMNPSKNFTEYREGLHSVNPPCVPFLGVYLTDLTFIEDGNPATLRGAPHLINFSKQSKTAEVIREIQQYQSVPYSLTVVPEIQDYLNRYFSESRDVQDLYDQSLEMEPRERDDEKMARLLQESGFL